MGLFETRPPPTPAFIIISEVYCIPYFQTQGGSPASATGFILRFILGPRSLKRNAIIHINQIAAYVCSFPGQHLRKDQENRGELTLYNFLWSLLNIFSIYLGPPKYPPKHGKSTRTMSLPSDNQRWLAGNSSIWFVDFSSSKPTFSSGVSHLKAHSITSLNSKSHWLTIFHR